MYKKLIDDNCSYTDSDGNLSTIHVKNNNDNNNINTHNSIRKKIDNFIEKSSYKEPLIEDNPNRHVIFPIKYPDIWDLCIKHREAFWSENEVDLSNDKKDWGLLSSNEKHFIKMVLAFFAASDGIVMENIATRFYKEIQIPEVRSFYSVQLFMENVHSIMYSQLIDTYITNVKEKNLLFEAVQNIPSIKKKASWANKWIESNKNFATRLAAFAAVEGIFFSGSFCCIYWIGERGKLPGLCKSNKFIAKDEGLHTDFACLLYNNHIVNKIPDDEINKLIKEAVDIETEFITESLPCDLLGMSSISMKKYIKFVANRLLLQLGYKELYPNIRQPFNFMDRICYDDKDNFFEGRVDSYKMSVSKSTDNIESNLDDLKFSDDF